MSEAKHDIADIRATLGRLERLIEGQSEIKERLARVEGRLEEQSGILQIAIASRIGRKPAAE